jgi:hypothetical protein
LVDEGTGEPAHAFDLKGDVAGVQTSFCERGIACKVQYLETGIHGICEDSAHADPFVIMYGLPA